MGIGGVHGPFGNFQKDHLFWESGAEGDERQDVETLQLPKKHNSGLHLRMIIDQPFVSQLNDFYITCLRRHSVVSASGFFTVLND